MNGPLILPRPVPSVAACILFCSITAAPLLAEPISLEELKQLGQQQTPAAQILAAAKTRGLGFDISLPIERELRRSGLSRTMVESLKRLEPPQPMREVAAPPAGGPQPPAAAAKLDPTLDAEYAQFDERLDRIVKHSNTSLVKVRGDHVTVVCEKELADRFLKDVTHLEQLFAKQFPAPLGSGPDARQAVIVFTRTRYDYQNFMESLFKQYEADGRAFEGPNVKESALAASNVMLDGLAVSCLEKGTVEASRHQVAYGVGYHYMNQLTHGKAPDSMLAGFGNFAETCLMQRPSVRLTSGYGGGANLNDPQNSWANLARQQLADGKVGSLRRVMNFDTAAMQTEDYAVCWSFMTLLSTGEEQLAKLVANIRDGADPVESITQLYGLDENEFLARWKSFAARQR